MRERTGIERKHVHKLDASAVLVTGVRAGTAPEGADDDGPGITVGSSWHVAIELPLDVAHPVYAHQSATLLGLEAFRQAGTALAHLGGDVPLDHKFIATRIAMEWTQDLSGVTGLVPASIEFRTVRAEHRRGVLVRHVFDATVTVGDAVVAQASGDLQCVDPRVHARLRSGAPTWEEAEQRHDLAALGSVRTTADGLDAWLGWDADDRMVFDHGVDHIPAMHLARAAMTAHHLLTADTAVTSLDVRCSRYVDLGAPADVHATRTAAGTQTSFAQGGHVAATVTCASAALPPLSRPAEVPARALV